MNAVAATASLDWLVDRVGCALTKDARAIAAVDASGRIHGMVAYDCWSANGVQCHMAVDTPIAWRTLIPAIFAYPFVEARRGVLMATVRSSNAKSLRMCARLGLSEVGRVPDGFAVGDDLVLLCLRREDCRWLAPGHRGRGSGSAHRGGNWEPVPGTSRNRGNRLEAA